MRYDLHIHTKYSRCSNLEPRDAVEAAKSKGLNGIAITDHNTISGALEAKRLNKDRQFEVIVGEEIQAEGGEILAYYLKKEIAPGRVQDVISNARKQGALIAIPHPRDFFRHHYTYPRLKELCKRVDAIETTNGRTINPIFNALAGRLARDGRKAGIGGSDAHFCYEVGRCSTMFSGSLREAIRTRTTSTKGSTLRAPLGIAHTFLHRNFLR